MNEIGSATLKLAKPILNDDYTYKNKLGALVLIDPITIKLRRFNDQRIKYFSMKIRDPDLSNDPLQRACRSRFTST